MESGDNQQHIRVLGREGIVVMDADRLGDWNIKFHIGSFFNPTSGLPFQRHLHKQRRNFCTLIKKFGPNQFVLVATSSAPLPPETTELFALQTLHGCLHLPYVCQLVVSTGYPKVVATYCRDITGPATSLFDMRIGPT